MARRTILITHKYRLRDSHSRALRKMANDVNIVWNFCNETQRKAVQNKKKWLNWLDLHHLTKGCSGYFRIGSGSINEICRIYDSRRGAKKKAWLKFRSRRSLGWIPLKVHTIRKVEGGFKHFGKIYSPMHWREIPEGAEIRGGSFNQDARGKWYINVTLRLPAPEQDYSGAVGVDLGLKELAVTSDGDAVQTPQFYRKSEAALGNSQRRKKTKRTKAIHRKVANRRKDYLHKAANKLVRKYGTIIVGDVSPSKLRKTRMAKSVLDASWATFKEMLRYKSIMNGGRMIEVDEAYTTQTCSHCGVMPDGRPRGIAGLGIREWKCGGCDTVLNRDVNAARNILRIGMDTLAEGVAA